MSDSFWNRLPLVRYEIDRDHSTRTRPDFLSQLGGDDRNKVLFLWGDRALMTTANSVTRVSLNFLPAGRVTTVESITYLGRSLSTDNPELYGSRLVTVALSDEQVDEQELAAEDWRDLRSVAANLTPHDHGVFTEALALNTWHRTHRYCPNCGAETGFERAGWSRRCPIEGTEIFPRIDPAVIVAVRDAADRILLGVPADQQEERFSLLAGFVEPGEPLEGAAAREVFEESGVRITDLHYLGSQPWPFPASLMCGFYATVDPEYGEVSLCPDGEEIRKLRWFSRDDVADPQRTFLLPGPASIARKILEHWYGGSIPDL